MTTTAAPTTSPSSTSRRHLAVAGLVAGAVAAGACLISAAPAQAATGVWYRIPAYSGGTAQVTMTTFYKTYGSGYAAGQIYLTSTGSKLYVQFKPNEGGTWNRGTSNRTSGAGYYSWSDNFTLNYSGFMFRICRDQLGPDACGTAVKVYG